MTTKALDLITIGRALNELSAAFLGDTEWQSANETQQQFLQWYTAHKTELFEALELGELASTDYQALNAFLVERGFTPQFQAFDSDDSIGVASVLDMLVDWVAKGELTTITRRDRSLGQYGGVVVYPAFRIMDNGVDFFEVEGFDHPLVHLRTRSGHGFWLMKSAQPTSGLELALTAQKLLAEERVPAQRHTVGVKVPMLEIDLQPDLSWILGLNTISPELGYHQISQAFQQFKLRANEKGARVKVATGLVATRGIPTRPVPYEFNEPFIGFFTQPGNNTLPVAAFWADTDSWRNPEGELEDL